MKGLKRSLAVFLAAATALSAVAVASANGAGGVTGPAFYVDGEQYRTVGTPTDLTNTGAPLHSFDVIYAFNPDDQLNVAEAAPGQRGYNGGRWMVRPVIFNTDYATTVAAYGSGAHLVSNEEIEAALADPGAAGATLGGVAASFECPVIPIPQARP